MSSATLLVVSKGRSIDEIMSIYRVGGRDFGESRVQEALSKMELLPKDIRWHFIGPLQKNKVRKIVGRFALIHSVDSFELAKKISEEATSPQSILLQVKLAEEENKQGFRENVLLDLFDSLMQLPNLKIEGLMTIAPLTENRDEIKEIFIKARQLKERLALKELSMGMSYDFPLALEEGATIIRIGSFIFN